MTNKTPNQKRNSFQSDNDDSESSDDIKTPKNRKRKSVQSDDDDSDDGFKTKRVKDKEMSEPNFKKSDNTVHDNGKQFSSKSFLKANLNMYFSCIEILFINCTSI